MVKSTNDCFFICLTVQALIKYNQNCVLDINGNRIYVKENLEDIKTQNLPLYLDDLFERFYEIQEKFDRDCKYDKEEDIFWI